MGFFGIVLAFAVLGSILGAGSAAARPAVEGYLPSNRGLDTTLAATDLSPYSDVVLAFINPDGNGSFVNGGFMACMTDRMLAPVPVETVQKAVVTIHAAHARAIGAIAGAAKPACAGDWAALAAPPRRAATVAALAALADRLGLDGLDVDIEGDLLARLVKSGDYTPFVGDLGRALHARHKTLYGTTASYVGGMIPLSALPAFDRVEVMTYDDNVPGEEEAAMAPFRSDLYLWLGRGVPKNRLILGVPFYGRGYGTYGPAYSYRDLVGQFGPQSGDLIGRMCATCSYITLNGPATIARKAALAAAKAGGVMVWELSEDTPDAVLAKAVKAGLSMAPPPPPASTGTPGAGRALNAPDVRAWTIYGSNAYALAPDGAGGQALEVKVTRPTEASWDVGVAAPIGGAVKAGDHITFAVRARLKAADPDTQLDIPAVIEEAAAPNAAVMQGKITVTAQWQWLRIAGALAADHAAGTLNAALQIGNAAKIIDLGPAVVTDEGASP